MSKYRNLIFLNRNLYFYLKSGYSIEKALLMLIEQRKRKGKINKILNNILKALYGGKSIYDSFKKVNKFEDYMLYIIKIGEESGTLAESFKKIYEYYEQKEKQEKKIIELISYPILVLFFSMVLFYILIMYFVPLIYGVLQEIEGSKLSGLKHLLNINLFLKQYGIYIFCILIVLVTGIIFCMYKKNLIFYFILNKVFIIKQLYLKRFSINFFYSLSLLIKSGFNLINALDIIYEIEKDPFIKEKLKICILNLKGGKSLSYALKQMSIFNYYNLNLVTVGEDTGFLEENFQHIYFFEKQKFNDGCNKFLKVLQPTIIILLGIVVFNVIYSGIVPIIDSIGGI